MTEPGIRYPQTVRVWVEPERVAALQEMGDPEKVDPGAIRQAETNGNLFEATLATDPTNSDGGIYHIRALDAAAIVHRSLLLHVQVEGMADGLWPPIIAPTDNPEDIIPIIAPASLLLGNLGIMPPEDDAS
jgi:hypothetical protein